MTSYRYIYKILMTVSQVAALIAITACSQQYRSTQLDFDPSEAVTKVFQNVSQSKRLTQAQKMTKAPGVNVFYASSETLGSVERVLSLNVPEDVIGEYTDEYQKITYAQTLFVDCWQCADQDFALVIQYVIGTESKTVTFIAEDAYFDDDLFVAVMTAGSKKIILESYDIISSAEGRFRSDIQFKIIDQNNYEIGKLPSLVGFKY